MAAPAAAPDTHASVAMAETSSAASSCDESSRRRATYTQGRNLQLTPDEKRTLVGVAKTLRTDTIAAFENHVHIHRRRIDTSQWKLVRRREHLAVVKRRTRSARNSDDATGFASSPTMPTLMAFGTVAGQLDDLLYGMSSHSAVDMRLQGSYSGANVHDAAVLATIHAPSLEEPFRFLGIKWLVQSHGVGSAMKPRELMFLESVGLTTLSTGETVGYCIRHSVEFKSMAHLSSPSVVRAKMSLCQLFRQKTNGSTLDVFMRGYFDPCGGRVSQMMATMMATDLILQGPGDALECANLKKLAWSAKQTGRRRRQLKARIRQSQRMAAVDVEEMRQAANELGLNNDVSQSHCFICHRSCGGILQRSSSSCMICNQIVCARCYVNKKLSFCVSQSLGANLMSLRGEDDPGYHDDIQQKALPFCLHCVVASNNQRSFMVAGSEMIESGIVHRPPAASGMSTDSINSAETRARASTRWVHPPRASQNAKLDSSASRRRAATSGSQRISTVLYQPAVAPPTARPPSPPGLVRRASPTRAINRRPKAFSSSSNQTESSTTSTAIGSHDDVEHEDDDTTDGGGDCTDYYGSYDDDDVESVGRMEPLRP